MSLTNYERHKLQSFKTKDPLAALRIERLEEALDESDAEQDARHRGYYEQGWNEACEACSREVHDCSEDRCLNLKDEWEEWKG